MIPNTKKIIKNIGFVEKTLSSPQPINVPTRIEDIKYQFAGKTGTSQVKRITEKDRELDLDQSEIEYKNRDHALFVAFAPYKDPRYSISVLIEHGGSGSKAAAPLAKKLIKKIIDRHQLREKIRKENIKIV